MLVKGEPGLRLIRGCDRVDGVVHKKMRCSCRIYPIRFVKDTIKFDCSLSFFYGELDTRFVFFLSEDFLGIDAGKKKSNYEKIFRLVLVGLMSKTFYCPDILSC